MLDHISLPVTDFHGAAAFYDEVLAALGLERRKQRSGAIGYGPPGRAAPVFWILQATPAQARPGPGLHVSFQAQSRSMVDAFHAAALRAGARSAGDPGLRPEYTQPFYGAFVFDPEGFKIEAVCRVDEPS